jgi:hypothetical protein
LHKTANGGENRQYNSVKPLVAHFNGPTLGVETIKSISQAFYTTAVDSNTLKLKFSVTTLINLELL